MADNQYITIMLQSLQKKEKVLNSIIQINKRQKDELENPSLDPDDFDKTVEEKSKLIEQLELLDNGFEKLYEKVREELQTNKELYKDEILKMQGCIRTLTDRSMEIQAQEARNKQLMEQKFALTHPFPVCHPCHETLVLPSVYFFTVHTYSVFSSSVTTKSSSAGFSGTYMMRMPRHDDGILMVSRASQQGGP